MAISFLGAGTVTSNTTAITPPFPTGFTYQAGDLNIGVGGSAGNEAFVLPSGWAHVLNTPVNLDTTVRLTVMYRFWQSGDTAPSWGDPGNHGIGCVLAYRGVKTTGNFWDAAPAPVTESAADTSATWNAVTTVTADCLILFIIATGRDLATTTNMGALSGGTGLGAFTERLDGGTASGTGSWIGLAEASKVAAGATGTPGATMGSTDGKALLTLPLAPEPVVMPPTSPLVAPWMPRRPRRF